MGEETSISCVLPLNGTRPVPQACILTGNRACDLLVRRLALYPLTHSSQGFPRNSSQEDTEGARFHAIFLSGCLFRNESLKLFCFLGVKD